ncbi:MAG TPA: family 10 glycosylhydrolase [Janthinobacterium sp.]|nr:family 10 glycosylhydrolase [Janthinobacterium sp.]
MFRLGLKKRLSAVAGATAALAVVALLSSCKTTPLPPDVPASVPAAPLVMTDTPPPAPREFRAAWVSTVANIDWPSRSNLNAVQQQAEAVAILDRAKALNLNAIVLQVRPSADAIYPSKLEPWSEFLTGQQGRPPKPLYDPLLFWVAQAHARGMELHAWFNPYRARHSSAKSPLTPEHIANTNPEAVKQYGKFLWMDPGEPAAAQRTLDVVLDVVRRYDIDGVQIDDYFYPYPIDAPGVGNGAGGDNAAMEAGAAPRPELEFPDQPAWQRYLLDGGHLERADWRRQNVNQMVQALYEGIHREKSWVRFGVSPFGIGRPDRRPAGIVGFSQYDKLYADAELWLANGWLDYLAPQLYWPIAQQPQAFDVLLDYWLAQNPRGRHIWPGLFTSRIASRMDNSAKAFAPEEIVKQIAVTRSRAGVDGQVHFSIAALMENRKGISDQLKATSYQYPALVPSTPWLGTLAPAAPVVAARREGRSLGLKLAAGPGEAVAEYAVWARYGAQWRFAVVPGLRAEWPLPDDAALGPVSLVVISAVDRLGNESARVTLPAADPQPAVARNEAPAPQLPLSR